MTSIATWKPTRGLFSTHSDIDRIFDGLFGKWDFPRLATHSAWAPPVDVVDAEDHVEFRAEVPGLSEDDVHVSVTQNVLTLKGEKKHESEEQNGNYHRVERRYGRFQRSFNLPRNLRTDDVSASFKSGILTISVPKAEEAQPKQIPISTE